jgi:hypothetical protein
MSYPLSNHEFTLDYRRFNRHKKSIPQFLNELKIVEMVPRDRAEDSKINLQVPQPVKNLENLIMILIKNLSEWLEDFVDQLQHQRTIFDNDHRRCREHRAQGRCQSV